MARTLNIGSQTASPQVSFETPVAPSPTPAPTTTAGTPVPSGNLVSNLKQLPGQLLDAGRTIIGKVGAATGANAIGEGLGTAALNIGKLAQGQNPNIPVDVPKMAGGILQAGATVAGAGLPIATAPGALARIGQSAVGYGALGGIAGAGSALVNKATAGGVLKSAAIGAGAGALGGVVAQGSGEALGAIKTARNATPTLQDTISVISPKETPVASAEDIAAGKAKAPTLLGKATIDHSETPYIQKAAQDVHGLVSPKESMIQNVNNVHDAIQNLSTDVVKPFLSRNPVPFNFEDLQQSLSLVKPSTSLKSDTAAFGTYGRVKEEIQQTLYDTLSKLPERGNSTDMNALWNARKAIDTKISQELGDATFGTPQYTGVKAAARDMRNAINDFISNSLANPGQMQLVNAMTDFLQTARAKGINIPTEGDAITLLKQQFGLSQKAEDAMKAAFFRESLSKMSGMYDAISNMAPKAYGELGKTGINLLLKKHPALRKVIGAGLSGVGLGLGFTGIESL